MNAVQHQGIGMTSLRTRERMIDRLKQQGIRDFRVLDVMRNTPRHLFLDEAMASRAYEDASLPIGNKQTLSQPYIVARMTEALLEKGNIGTVLEVGTGSGYQTAILAPFVQRVFTCERIESLLVKARERFCELDIRNVRTRHADGNLGLPMYGPFDGIIVTAAPEGIPLTLVNQLKVGGRMVLPVGTKDEQALVRVERTEHGHETELLERVSFVPLLAGIC